MKTRFMIVYRVISTVAEWIIWSIGRKVSKVLAMCLCVSRSGSQGVPKAPLGFRTIFWGWVPCGSRFWSLARTLTRTTATIFPYDNQRSRAGYGHVTKKAVSSHVFVPAIKRRVGLGTLIFGPKTVNFGDPHFSQAFFFRNPFIEERGAGLKKKRWTS